MEPKIRRRKTKTVKIGKLNIGSNWPVAIQSMTKTKTEDANSTIRQINSLEKKGCQIIRVAIRDRNDAKAIKKIRPNINIPLVADIHFDYRLALEAIDNGVDKIRLNPGNIYNKQQLKKIARAANFARIPIRVGLNSGSLPRRIGSPVRPLVSYGTSSQRGLPRIGRRSVPDIMVREVCNYINMLEDFRFNNIVVSMKSSSVCETVMAYRKLAKYCNYPFHLGITATGLGLEGAIKSAIGIGSLLVEGIGDTIRVSLTDTPQAEVGVARLILKSLNLTKDKYEIISCPTCGRCQVDLVKIVKELERKLQTVSCKPSLVKVSADKCLTRPMKLAVMGCMVNGPGEAKQADLGVAFGKSDALLFKKGKIIKKIKQSQIVDNLVWEWRRLC